MATTARIDDLRKKFDENPRRYFAPLANEYRKAGDLEQAIAICRQHLADQPGHMSGHIVYGQALFEHGEHAEAQAVFTAALALDPENLIALRLLGDIARDGGDYENARTWYQRVLDADPRNEDIQSQLKLVEEAHAQAVAAAEAAALEATLAPTSPTPTASPIALRPSQDSVKTVEIERVTPPWAKSAEAVSIPESEPLALPSLGTGDVAPPRLSLMGLDLESMARVTEPPSASLVPQLPASTDEYETTAPFSSKFDNDLESDLNPLAGISGMETRDESSAASLMRSAPPEATPEPEPPFKITPPFGQAASEAEAPEALVVSRRVTPPTPDLVVSPPPAPTGLWDAADDAPAEPAGVARHSPSNFEPPALQFDAPEDHAEAATEPFVTETMADLYVQQGHRAEALATYRRLLASRPGDHQLEGKIAALEAAPAVAAQAGPLVREFFAALARWLPGASGSHAAVPADAGEDVADDAPVDAAAMGAPTLLAAPAAIAASWMGERAFDLGVFAGAAIDDADEAAAQQWAAVYPEPPGVPSSGASVMTAPATLTSAEALPGKPAHAASSELSLNQVFTDAAPQRPSRKSASFSFDQFFSQTAQVSATPRQPTPSAAMPAQPSAEEAEQFQNWLKGLKGP